jgi:hypothetical protein
VYTILDMPEHVPEHCKCSTPVGVQAGESALKADALGSSISFCFYSSPLHSFPFL